MYNTIHHPHPLGDNLTVIHPHRELQRPIPVVRPFFLFIPLLVPLLLLSRIPPQLAANTIHPVLAPSPLGLHRRKGEPARADGDVVAGLELDALPAVEARPGRVAGVVGDADAQDDGVGEDDGAEGEGVRADGRHEHDGVLGVAEGAAGGEVVGCRAGGG